MKKVFAVILAVLLCLSALSGCKEVEQKTFDIYGGNPPAESASDQSASGEEADELPEKPAEPGMVEGITVVSGVIYKPGEGEMAYTPSDADGYFAVDGTLNAQSTIGICVDPNGILNFDLELATDTEMSVDAEVRVYKDGSELVSYSEGGLVLPAGSTIITACVNTKEAEPCSGEYTVEFYINGTLLITTTDPICDAV